VDDKRVNLHRALEQTADSVLLTDRQGAVEYVNPAFERLTGFARADVVGQTPRFLRSGVHTKRFYGMLWRTILSGHTFRATITNRGRDGCLFDTDQTITPVRDRGGAITHFVSVSRDITRRRRVEALKLQRQLDREAKRVAGLLHAETGQFLALAHITLSEVSRKVDPDVSARLHEVRQYLTHLEQHLGGAALGTKPVAFGDRGLAEALTFLARACSQRTGMPIVVESSLDGVCPAAVETLLYQAVKDLLAGMRTGAPAGSASIVLAREVSGRRAGDDAVLCAIRDPGAHLDVAAFASGGHGASTPALQERVEALGGRLEVAAVPGQATEVRITVPLGE
jgi:PAS domain S-box-containing protein